MAATWAYGETIRIRAGFDAWYIDYKKVAMNSSIDGCTAVLQGTILYANGEVRYIVRLKNDRIVVPVPAQFVEALE